MEPATGALIASAIAGSIGAYGASKGSQDAAAAADARTGGLLSSTKAALATASEKANKLEAEVARLKIEIARCGGLQSQLDALTGPELAFKNAKAEVLRRAGVEFLLPELIEFLPDRASIERMKKVLDFPTDLVDTLNRMTLRKFYETRVLKVVPPMAPAPSAPPAVAAAAPPSEMDAELEALRGGRRTRRPRQAKRSRRGRGGANGAAQSEFAREAEIGTLAAQFPTPAAPAPAPAAPAPAPAAPENNALEAAADALPDAPAAPAAPVVPEQAPEQVPEVPEPVPGAPEEVPEPVPVGAPPPPPPPPAGPAPVIEGSAPLAKPFPDYATFAPMMARAIQMASVAPPAAAAAAAPGPPPAPAAPAAVAAPAAPSEAEDRIAKTAALVLADQIDRMLILPEAVGITPDIERDRALAREFRDRAANVTAAEWPGLQQEGEELMAAIEEHIDAAPGDQGMNAAEYAAMDAVAPGQREVVIPGAMPRAPPAASAAPAVARAPAPDWRAALNAAAERRRAEAAAAAAAVVPAAAPAVADVVPAAAPAAPDVVPEPAPVVPAAAAVVPEPLPAPVVPEPLPAAPAVADVVPAAAAVVPEPLPAAAPRANALVRQAAMSRDTIAALRPQAPAAPAPQPGRFRQFVRNLTRKNRAAPPAAPAPAPAAPAPAPAAPAVVDVVPEPPAPVDPIQAKRAEVDGLMRRHQEIVEREANLFAENRPIPAATTNLRKMLERQIEQAENTLRLLRRNQAAAAGTGLVMNQPPAPADEEDGGRPEPPAAPVAPQTFAESAEAVRAIQEAQTPQANPFIVQAYRDSVEPPVAAENVAQVPPPVAAAPPVPGATKLFGPLPGAQVGVSPGFAAAAAEGTRKAKRAQENRKTQRVRAPLTQVPVLPLTPTAARAMVGAPIAEDAAKFALENPMAKGHMTLKKRLKEVPARLTKTQFDVLDADMKPYFTKEERKFPGLPDMYSRNAKRVVNPEGGVRKRTLKNRRGLNKRKNVRGSRHR